MKRGLEVVLENDRKKVERQIAALEEILSRPENDISRRIHEETLSQLKEHLNLLKA